MSSEQASLPGKSAMPDEFSPRHLGRRLLGLVLLVALAAGAVSSLPGLGTIRARFAEADPILLVIIGLLKLCSCLSNVVAFRDVFCRGMSWRFSFELGMAEQATNVLLPTGGAGGLALGAWALRESGMSTEYIARRSVVFFVLTSIPNFLCAAGVGPLLLAGILPGEAPVVLTAIFTVLAWLVSLFVASLPVLLRRVRPREAQSGLGRKLRSGLVALANGIRDTGELLRARRWRAIGGAFGYMGFDTVALAVAFAAFGPALPVGSLIFAYVIGQLGGLIPLPAGIGGTDGGLIGAMVLYGSPLSQAVAAVLAYRTFQLAVPAVLGTVAFVKLRQRLSRSEDPGTTCAPLAHPRPEEGREHLAA
ncbi:MAG: putative heme transporter [Trebonia sp.]|nr:putative heme transporter [Trebonia sp.]